MLDRRDLLMAKLVAGMMMGLEKTTAYLEQSLEGREGFEEGKKLVAANREWLAMVRKELGMDEIF